MSRAIVYMILSACFFTGVNLCIKYLDDLHTFQHVFFRSFGSLLCGLVLLKRAKIPIFGQQKFLLFLRGICGVIAMALFFRSIQMMPSGTAITIRNTSPLIAAALAVLFLGERMRWLQWVFFSTALAGVALLKGYDPRVSVSALAVITTSAFFTGLVFFIIRKIGTSEHSIVIVNYLMMCGSLLGGLGCLFYWITPAPSDWYGLVSIGLFGFGGQYFLTKALQIEEANIITPFKYIEVILLVLFSWLLFDESQSMIALLAMLIIILSLSANVWIARKKAQ